MAVAVCVWLIVPPKASFVGRVPSNSHLGRSDRSTISCNESLHAFDECCRLLDFGMMAGLLDQLERRARDQSAVGAAIVGRYDTVACAPKYQGRHSDPAKPARQLRVVHERLPPIQTKRIAVARMHHDCIIRHDVKVERPLCRIVPGMPFHLGWCCVEQVQDVAALAIAELDTKR